MILVFILELYEYLWLFLFLLLVESNQKSSFQEIPKLNEELLSKQKQLEKIESGDLGLSKVWINITEMNKQVAKVILFLYKLWIVFFWYEFVDIGHSTLFYFLKWYFAYCDPNMLKLSKLGNSYAFAKYLKC